jgi:hypothetical protein
MRLEVLEDVGGRLLAELVDLKKGEGELAGGLVAQRALRVCRKGWA